MMSNEAERQAFADMRESERALEAATVLRETGISALKRELAEKNETANVFMKQVKKLQAANEAAQVQRDNLIKQVQKLQRANEAAHGLFHEPLGGQLLAHGPNEDQPLELIRILRTEIEALVNRFGPWCPLSLHVPAVEEKSSATNEGLLPDNVTAREA